MIIREKENSVHFVFFFFIISLNINTFSYETSASMSIICWCMIKSIWQSIFFVVDKNILCSIFQCQTPLIWQYSFTINSSCIEEKTKLILFIGKIATSVLLRIFLELEPSWFSSICRCWTFSKYCSKFSS